MCRLALLSADAFTSVASFLTFDDVLPLAACSRSLLTEHRLGHQALTVTWRHPVDQQQDDHGAFKNLAAFASLLQRQHCLESLTLRVQMSPPAPAPLPWPTTSTPTAAGELLADCMEVAYDTPSITSTPAFLPSSFPPLVLPVLPYLTSLHVKPASLSDPSLPPPPPTFLPLSSSSSSSFSSSSSSSSSSLAMATTAHLLGSLLHPPGGGGVPRLHTLCLHARDLLDDAGLEHLAHGFEQQQQQQQQQRSEDEQYMHEVNDINHSSSPSSLPPSPPPAFRLNTLVLEPPRLSQGRGLSRLLLSGPFHLLKHLTLRHLNGLGTTALQRFLTLSHAPRLETLCLLRCDGQLAWGDPVAEALALPHVAPCLRVLEAAFLPFGTKAAHALIARRFHHGRRLGCLSSSSSSSSPSPPSMTVLRLWAAGLGYIDMCKLLGTPPSHPLLPPSLLLPPPLHQHHHLQDLRVLCLNFHSSHGVAALLPSALAAGACPRLEELSLVQCRLDDAFAVALAAVLMAGGSQGGAAAAGTAGAAGAAGAGIAAAGTPAAGTAAAAGGIVSAAAAAAAAAAAGRGRGGEGGGGGGAARATTLRTLDLAYNGVGAVGLQALLGFAMFSPGCGLTRLRLDGNPLGGMEGVLMAGGTLLGQQPQQQQQQQQQQHLPCLRRLETLELRRVRLWRGREDAVQAREAVAMLVQALLWPGRAPALRRLVLGVEATRGVNVEGQEGGGYLPPGTMKEVQALLARHRQRQEQQEGEEERRRRGMGGGRGLEVMVEGGSPFMGLGF